MARDLLVVPYPTRMSIVRLDDGALWLASPVACSPRTLEEVSSLGPVCHLLASTPRHHWRLEPWHARFRNARLWSCELGPFTLGKRSLPAERLGDVPPAEWAGQIDQALYRGRGFQEVTFFHCASRTLLVEDIIQSHPSHPGSPPVNALITIGGIAAPGGVPRDIRAITPRRAGREWVEKVLSWDFETLVMAHGPAIRSDARAFVHEAFGWLLRR